MKIFKSKREDEAAIRIKGVTEEFVREFLVPGIRLMLRNEYARIEDIDKRLSNVEIELPGIRSTVSRIANEEGEKIGSEIIKHIMGTS